MNSNNNCLPSLLNRDSSTTLKTVKTDLKEKSGACMIDDKIQDYTIMNGASYYSHKFLPSPIRLRMQLCDLLEMTSVQLHKNCDTETKCRLN